jgi:hypothetical protein
MSTHDVINSKLYEENLPPLDYRISADYGEVQLAKSTSPQRSESLQQEMLEKAKKIHIFDQGLGFGIGWFLKSLLKNFDRTCLTKQITIENLLMA